MRWREDGGGILARLVVGSIWLVAGALKLPDPAASVRAVRAYQLLPESVVPLVGYGLPVLEVVLGLCLLAGALTRVASVLSVGVLAVFIAAIASAWARGLSIDCGCFGGGSSPTANAAAAYPWDIARDVGLLLLSAWLVRRPHTPWSVDRLLLGAPARLTPTRPPEQRPSRGTTTRAGADGPQDLQRDPAPTVRGSSGTGRAVP